MNPRNDAALLYVQGDDDQHVEAWHWRNSMRESDACVLIKRDKECWPVYNYYQVKGADVDGRTTWTVLEEVKK